MQVAGMKQNIIYSRVLQNSISHDCSVGRRFYHISASKLLISVKCDYVHDIYKNSLSDHQ
jgi:hypothetical protein